ncbi:Uncharacterised protein [Mycobacterium tuberculosis]|nr:Uncharacterised protein [Mycobacterium tuberculosis]
MPWRSKTTHQVANRQMAARVGSPPGTPIVTSNPRSRRNSTVSHSRTMGSALPAWSRAPTAINSAATGSRSARSAVSNRGNNGRNPSSGQVCSTPVTACSTHRPSTVVVSMSRSSQPASSKQKVGQTRGPRMYPTFTRPTAGFRTSPRWPGRFRSRCPARGRW